MNIEDHYALSSGSAPLADGRDGAVTVHDLGILRVPSGQLGASDPFVFLDESLVIPIPPGDYPVRVTVADVSEEQDGSHLREAYLSVVLSEAESHTVGAAQGVDGPPPADEYFGIGVDAGTVGFVDAEAVLRSMPDGATWYDEVFDTGDERGWFAIMDADSPQISGTANIVMPNAAAGENVVLSHSGWGDGFYSLLETRDIDGNLTGIHIDLQVVGLFEDEDEDVADDETPTTSEERKPRNWLARLFGR